MRLRDAGGLIHGVLLAKTAEIDGRRFYNDSTATTPESTIAALRALKQPVWLLAGGRNKGLDFTPLTQAAARVRMAFVFGEAAPALETALRDVVEVVCTTSLAEALTQAARRAAEGEVVLLSPACASFDQFKSFEERGEHFAALARGLPC